MDKLSILEKISNKKIKDYSFTIAFFLIFALFIFFAIKPNLTTAFALQRELADLHSIDKNYETAILKIVTIQTAVEQSREKLYLLDEALPHKPEVNKVIDDINTSASVSGILIKKMDIGTINLKQNQKLSDKQGLVVSMEIGNDFARTRQFIDTLLNQRRLKMVKNIQIERDTTQSIGSGSGSIKIQLEVDGYYL